ncbi:hypothetical protein MHTCC0001_23500 [Flavobacteriaceae bacterium MHTCC 0001]
MLNGLLTFSVALHEYVHYADWQVDNKMINDPELGEFFEATFIGGYYEFNKEGEVVLIPAD